MKRYRFIVTVGLLAILVATLVSTAASAAEPSLNEKTYDWRGFDVYYQVGGTGRPVVLIHGLRSHSYTWRRCTSFLARIYRVYTIDLLGFGKSAKPDIVYSPDVWANLVAEFIEDVAGEKASVVGHSLGGLVAARLAAKYPELVDQLILIAPAGLPQDRKLKARLYNVPVIGEAVFRMSFKRSAVAKMLRKELYANPAGVTEEDISAYYEPLTTDEGRAAMKSVLKAFDKWSVVEDLPRVTAPTLIIWGENDKVIPVGTASRFKGAIPNSRLETLPKCGHAPQEEFASKVKTLIVEFVSQSESLFERGLSLPSW